MSQDIGREDTDLWWTIREVAYQLWEERCRAGQEHLSSAEDDWFAAERRVKEEQV